MKIEFTEKEIDIIERCISGEIDIPAGETGEMVGNILERALAYENEVKPEKEPDDLLLWYYDQYKKQQ